MAFTVEDGTIVTDANAYITVAFFTAWHDDRGNDYSNFASDDIEKAIIKATDYVDKRFGDKFVGYRRQTHDAEQSLEWPRLDAFDNRGNYIQSSEVPKGLKRAIAEYAFLALTMTLLPVPAPSFNSVDPTTGETTVASGSMLTRDYQKVGPIEEDKWYSQDQWRLMKDKASGQLSNMVSGVNLPEYPVADEWLKQIVKSSTAPRLSRG